MVPSESQPFSAKWVRGESVSLALEHLCSSRELSEPCNGHSGKQTTACPVRGWPHMLAVSTHNPHLTLCYLHPTDEEAKAEHWLPQPCLERLSAITLQRPEKTDQGKVRPKNQKGESQNCSAGWVPRQLVNLGTFFTQCSSTHTPYITLVTIYLCK